MKPLDVVADSMDIAIKYQMECVDDAFNEISEELASKFNEEDQENMKEDIYNTMWRKFFESMPEYKTIKAELDVLRDINTEPTRGNLD
jgi:hypothetical protein